MEPLRWKSRYTCDIHVPRNISRAQKTKRHQQTVNSVDLRLTKGKKISQETQKGENWGRDM